MTDAWTFSGWTESATLPTAAPVTRLGYAAAESSNKRKSAPLETGTEDFVLRRAKRRALINNTRDIRRNFALAAWIIRKHLDYVAAFSFNVQSTDAELNKAIEKRMKQWQRPKSCDASRRFSLRKMLRLIEAKAIVDGDAGFLKIQQLVNGQRVNRLQGIEGDRLGDPPDLDNQSGNYQWIQGVKVDTAFRHLAYSIHRRGAGKRTEYERTIQADRMIWHNGYVENFDQVRGVSPLAPGLNGMRDLYENFDYALARSKISQLFAFAITRKLTDLEGDDELGYGNYTNAQTGTAFDDEDAADQTDADEYDVDFGRGNVFLDLKPGHDAKFLESNQPSDQFQSFTTSMLQLTLKALDIPFSFYSEDFTNFFGSRAALQHYERSCQDRRETLQEILREITVWNLITWILNGEIKLPRGWTLEDIPWEWVPDGVPWWDPAKEIRGDLMAIQSGLDTPQRICKERGRGDYFENIDEIKRALDYAKTVGVPVSFAPQPDQVVLANQ